VVAALLLVVIVVVMAAIVFSWSRGVFGSILPPPANGKETFALENQGFNIPNNNVTLYLRDTGTTSTTFVSYYVQDMSHDQCAKASGWSSGPYLPTQLAIVTLGITSPNCAWTGTPFTFQSGNSYQVILVTSHNNQFTFTFQR
jgi:hypothetical protein